MLIAIDFDGTIADLVEWEALVAGPVIDGAIDGVTALYEAGHTLQLWTCREFDKLEIAKEMLKRYNIIHCFTYFNENPPEQIIEFKKDCRKSGADLFIDDRTVDWHINKWDNIVERVNQYGKLRGMK